MGKEEIKDEKKERQGIIEYFAHNRNSAIGIMILISIILSVILIILTYYVAVSDIQGISATREVGFPLPWLRVNSVFYVERTIYVEINNWFGLILDFILYFVITLAILVTIEKPLIKKYR